MSARLSEILLVWGFCMDFTVCTAPVTFRIYTPVHDWPDACQVSPELTRIPTPSSIKHRTRTLTTWRMLRTSIIRRTMRSNFEKVQTGMLILASHQVRRKIRHHSYATLWDPHGVPLRQSPKIRCPEFYINDGKCLCLVN